PKRLSGRGGREQGAVAQLAPRWPPLAEGDDAARGGPMHDPLDDWDYVLPEAQLARTPAARRDGSRLLHVPLADGGLADHTFNALPELLREGDLLVLNDTRVLRARLRARRASGGEVEVLLLGVGPGEVEALIRPMRKVRDGERLEVPGAGVV